MKILGLFVVLGALITSHIVLGGWTWLYIPLTAFVAVVIAMFAHEGGHRALSDSAFRNNMLLHVGFPLFAGLSAMYWKHKHNVKHHAYPNIAEEDPDLSLFPMASSSVEYEKSGPFRRWIQRNLQGKLFWPFTFFLAWSMRHSSLSFLLSYVRTKGVDGRWLLDVGCMFGHVVLWLVIPSFFFGPLYTILFYYLLWTVGGAYLAAIFAPAHMGLPVLNAHDDMWRLQLETTRNLHVPLGMGAFFVGLDHQIEHHLFPRIPHQNMKKASVVVKQWAAREGLPYNEIGYLAGLKDVTRFMETAWKVAPSASPYMGDGKPLGATRALGYDEPEPVAVGDAEAEGSGEGHGDLAAA